MSDEAEYLTQEKYDELLRELQSLKTNRRREIAETLEYAKSLGDLSENAEYHEARAAQAGIEDRIARLETILKNAVIIRKHRKEEVGVGSTVTLEKRNSGGLVVYKIVGSEESDLGQGKLSNNSPLGIVLAGKKKGEKVSFTSPSGDVCEYKILEIE